jgi:hypothetical protein
MKGVVEQPVNIVWAAGTTCRAIRLLLAETSKETQCPAMPLDTACPSFLVGRKIVMRVFKCASVLLVPTVHFIAFINFNR